MEIKLVPRDTLKKNDLTLLIDLIYYNFEYISNIKELNHNKKQIEKILKSDDSYVLFILNNNKITAYMIAQSMLLRDGRIVFYIYYLYTSPQFRNMGLASKLIEIGRKIGHDNNCIGVMLTCDTSDTKVHNYYLKKGFMPDMLMRKYDRFDVLYL